MLDIWHYFADAASPDTADTLLRNIDVASARLSGRPMPGRPRADIAPGMRSILMHPVVIIYRVSDDSVEIALVQHARQDIAAAFDEGDS